MTVRLFGKEKGFTLIELLVVIAVLGILAVVVLIAIDPLEQMAKARDSGRLSGVTQVGHAMQAYYTSRSEYPPADDQWGVALTDSGELSIIPSEIKFSVTTFNDNSDCAANPINNTWCYDLNGDSNAIIYSPLESKNKNSICQAIAADQYAYAVYSTADGRGGVVCELSGGVGAPSAAGELVFQ
jgi:prepilin-type N-terminal cleavage/methylation domain-containing protein